MDGKAGDRDEFQELEVGLASTMDFISVGEHV
jgi:hypothetical protein